MSDVEKVAEQALGHSRTCSYFDDEIGCTCCLKERQALATEQAMHRAWRKRAEEAEVALAAWNTRPAPAGDLAALAQSIEDAAYDLAVKSNTESQDNLIIAHEKLASTRAAFHAALAAHLAEVRAAIEPLRALHVAQVAAWPASEQWDDRCSIMVDWPVVCRIAALAKKLEG